MAALWAPFFADMMEDSSSTMCAWRPTTGIAVGQDTAWCISPCEGASGRGINKVSLIAFKSNEAGNEFSQQCRLVGRSDVNYYDFVLNEENITNFNNNRGKQYVYSHIEGV